MAKKKTDEPEEVVYIPEPTLLERLDALIPHLEVSVIPGAEHELVRLALLNVLGAVEHVHSALDQVRILKLSDQNRAAVAARTAAQDARERRSNHG